MKKIKTILIVVTLLLTCNFVSAQFGNGYGNGYGNGNGNGNGRMSQMNQMNQSQTPSKPREIPVEETAAKIMEQLKPDLNLDQLQEIAITNVLIGSLREQGILMKAETTQEQKSKEMAALSETTTRKMNAFLNEDQKIKYKELIAAGPGGKKKLDKKKSRKKR
jgi:hypothetical protein